MLHKETLGPHLCSFAEMYIKMQLKMQLSTPPLLKFCAKSYSH